MADHKAFSIAKVKEITYEVMLKNIRNRAVSKESRLAFLQKLIEVSDGFRFYMLSDQQYVGEIWDTIRRDKKLTDFVLASTCELRLSVGDYVGSWLYLSNRVAEAFCLAVMDSYSMSVVDDDTMEMFPKNGEDFKTMLSANPWLVFIILISTLDLFAMVESETKSDKK